MSGFIVVCERKRPGVAQAIVDKPHDFSRLQRSRRLEKSYFFLWLAQADDYPPLTPLKGGGTKRKSLRLLHVSSPQAPHLPGPGRFITCKSVCHGICYLQKSPSLKRCASIDVSGDFFAGIYARQPFDARALPGKR